MRRAFPTMSLAAGLGLTMWFLGCGDRLASPGARAQVHDASGGSTPVPQAAQDKAAADRSNPAPDRSKLADSFKYYGPNGLWYTWTKDQKIGRDTWFFYTGGTQKFYRILSRFGGDLGISLDFTRLLASSPEYRFREIGLINEPNFDGKVEDEFGFTVDKWKGDPYPGEYPDSRNPDIARSYGEPTGIIGMRKFANPGFTQAMADDWKKDKKASLRRYFSNPGKVEPPFLVGITCVLCHVAFDPLNPPLDPVKPRWENLAANIGNQYLREGDLFFGAGRIVGGDANPGPTYPDNPYDTKGLDQSSFLYQYGHTQEPGTSETSRFSYDFINNPNTINQIINIGSRAVFHETTPIGTKVITNHVLKDGSDSVGIHAAVLRVYINIGSEGDYWADHLWNPATGTSQRPFSLEEVRLAAGLVEPKDDAARARKANLLARYPELGQAWKETERRVPFVVSYLASYTPYELASIKDADGSPKYITKDANQLERGKLLYAQNCALCHSNKQPFYPLTSESDKARYFAGLVPSDQFLPANTLSDDVRYPFDYPGFGINAARALATNAVDGDIWADFSSKDYKALPPLGYMTFENPLHTLDRPIGTTPIVTEFIAPGGGRGYYRTAALNSMWATAPYLHNNAVGRAPVDADGKIDPKAMTVEGRLALFEDAINQLLNPVERKPMIKVTSADSSLIAGLPGVEGSIAAMVAAAAKQAVEETIHDVFADLLAKAQPPADVKAEVAQTVQDLQARFKPELDKLHSLEELAKSKIELVAKIKGQIEVLVAEKLKGKPKVAGLLAQLHAKLEAALQARLDTLSDLVASKFAIPKGTPVNLFMNLNIARVPYALKMYIKYQHDPATLAAELLTLSDCPDLVENRGHTFGSQLSPDDKRALCEYLKTL